MALTETSTPSFRMTSASGGRVPGHAIRWYVWAWDVDGGNRQKLPHTASLRGHWPAWDATCECGWGSHTGGATRESVRRDVWDHKLDVHLAR